jgi:drug/metabolite transporter (DMT)-like permease
MSSLSANRRGILAMIGASACFSANDAATKIAVTWIPPSEIVAIRAVFTLLFAFAIIAVRGEIREIAHIREPKLLFRALAETITGFILITAFAFMPLANVIAILLVQPFLMTMIAVVFLKQTVGWRRWMAVAIGFVGMLLVVKPATEAFNAISLLVLGATLMVVARDLLTNQIRAEVPTTVITFATALVGIFIGGIGAAAEPWRMPDLTAFIIVVIAAVFLVAAFILIVIAFRGTEVALVAPFRYGIVVFAVVYGIILFNEIPDRYSVAGIALIVGAGIYMIHREAVRRREAVTATPIAGPGVRL